MDVVRQILRNCFDHVHHKSRDSSFPSLLIVTEVPNIKERCTLIESFLSLLRRDFTRIRIAYVEEDVEFIKDYAIEQSKEKGVDDNLNWCDLESNGVNNRALVLLSVSEYENCTNKPLHRLHKMSYSMAFTESGTKDMNHANDDDSVCAEDISDEEDAFLTKRGMFFTRKAIWGHGEEFDINLKFTAFNENKFTHKKKLPESKSMHD